LTRISSASAGGGWLAGPWVARALWSRATPEVFYRRGDELVAITYRETAGRFTVVGERTVVRLPAFEFVGLSPDANRFPVGVATGAPPSRDIDVVLNWPAQLRGSTP